jgi:PKD repeat protein
VTSLRLPGHGSLTWIWLASLVLAGCNAGDGLVLPGDGNPATIRVVQGNGQSGRVGESLAEPVVVKVTDSRGHPVQNVTVAFELTDAGPGAEIDPETATTGSNGEADTRMRLGTRMGPQTGEARVVTDGEQEPKASFTVTALSENADGIAAESGDDQSGPVGSILPDPLVVEVTDAFGNPISGVPISWTAAGGGSVSEALVSTDAQGRASVERQLGPAAGPQTTVASSEGLAGSPVTFTHAATAGNASGLSILSGNDQTGEAGTRLPADLVVRLLDADGNGVSNTAVTWVVGTGGGSVTPENGITDDAGRSSAQWTLGPNPGENRIDAVVSGVGVVTFRATGIRAGPSPTVTTITSDAPDPSVAGSVITVNVQVTSSAGTPAGSVTVSVTGAAPPPPCTVSLSNGTGSCQFALSVVGNRTFTAVYSGGSGFAGSQDTEPHVVVPANPSNRAPDADYNWHCEGLTCAFTDASSDPDGQVSGWSWNFRDGNPGSNERNPSHTFPGPGEYQVTLTVTDNGGATDQSTAAVEVDAPPPGGTTTTITGDGPDPSVPGQSITVSFTVTSPSGTPAGNVQVTDGIGGGCTGSAPSGSCSYTPGGTGTRTITAMFLGNSSFSGSSDTEEHTVNAPPPPPPAGTTTTITGDGPDPSDPGASITVSFTVASSSGTPTGTVEVTDQNGGGCTGSAPSDSCSYTPNGTGSRTITATYQGNPSFNGSEDTEEHTVNTPPPPNQEPTAAFTPPTCTTGQPCQFTDGSSDSDGTVVEWEWDFDDSGAGSTLQHPTHTFDQSGSYTVKLRVKDDDGAQSDEVEHEVPVNDPPPPPNGAPTATIGSISCNGMSCTFVDDSTDPDGDETITQWSWIFGDGGTSDLQNPVHEYAAPGDYSVTLEVTDDQGATDSDDDNVSVQSSEGGG